MSGQPSRRAQVWTEAELATLAIEYRAGPANAAKHLPGRSLQAISVKASKLGIHTAPDALPRAPRLRLSGADLEEAITLRNETGMSFAKIGLRFGVAEISAQNAVLMALCPRLGYTPAQRHPNGRLTDEGIARLREMFRKGVKAVDISLRLGLSAACIAEQRRRYKAKLRRERKVQIPEYGASDRYSGRKLTKAERAAVEAMFLEGYGAPKISKQTGISKTTCGRIRKRLVKKLARKKIALPGCNIRGRRTAIRDSNSHIPPDSIADLRKLLLARVPVAKAARATAIGATSAYKIRDELRAELAAAGRELPPPILPGRVAPGYDATKNWPPSSPKEFADFRTLLRENSFEEAKTIFRQRKQAARQIERERPKSFEEQLEMVGRGELGLTAAFTRPHLQPTLKITEKRHDASPQRAHV